MIKYSTRPIVKPFSKLLCFVIALVLFNTALAQGFTPTQAQIEQFKRMSPAEQQALASSMGINLDDYAALLGGSGNTNANQNQFEKEVSGPRTRDPQGKADGDESELERNAQLAVDELSLEEDKEVDALNEELELFGYDIFQFGADAFTPATDIPIPTDYVLGPGDTLVIQLFGKENNTHTLTIDRDGQVMFPNIGPVTLAGLSFSRVSAKIEEVVGKQMIGVQSSVTMGALRTIRIFVLGDANVPGSYIVGSLSTMTNAIFASGGVTKIGSLRNIQLKRAGKLITTLDLYDLLLKGDTSSDVRLLPGDVIFIPPIGKTTGIAGEVKRPAIYELRGEQSVEQVLKLAGGLLPTAYVPASRIERILPESGEKTLVNLDLSTRKGRTFKVQDADVIQIFSTLDTMRDIVKLEGHVKRPSGFAWRPNMRFTDIVIDVDDLLSNPDIEVGVIQRERKDTRKIEVITFSPKLAFANPGTHHNPLLESRDTITLFDYTTDRSELLLELLARLETQSNIFERQQTIEVTGSVRFPGKYPLAREMNARDAIALAGGLTEAALGTSGEITRYDLNEERSTIVMHIDLDMRLDNPILQAGDTLRLKQVPLWQKKESITLLGEVVHPGAYSILPGETLMDVLHRAGGLTPHAYSKGAVFSREELRRLEEERLADLREKIESEIAAATIQESNLKKAPDEEQAEQILENIEKVTPLGRMVIDLPAIMKTPETFDFQLVDGDTLEIPRFKPSVTVVGEVQFPTSHFFDKKLSLNDYIDRSGGTKNNADKKRIYIVKANGRVYLPSNSAWFRSKGHALDPGDTIVVPLDTDRVDRITMWSSVTQMMYQAALGIAALSAF
ncbi:protein involved in polysaccharide export, contains SLBB domain of the beta-grasp fold [Alteromonadaceae bacterium Bs31]|nr:protein involved in polysaccharide export, contains SLBB domain of the beta-grasp fold [Alteromonadaceae bacterium Bs31]